MPSIEQKFKYDHSLKAHNSWKVGGSADLFLEPVTLSELREGYAHALKHNLPVSILSQGTNVLISDDGIRGLTICMHSFKKPIELKEDANYLKFEVLSGTTKSELAKIFLSRKLAPALFLTGLPGDVGGGIVMNAGVSETIVPREFGEIVEWIDVLSPDGSVRRLTHEQVIWRYRSTSGWQPGVIVGASIKWPLQEDPEIMVKVKKATKNRLVRQPLDKPSGGSTFRNPPGAKAGQLIEQSGLKGFRIGGAQVSEKHANFIVTEPSAKAQDIHRLIEHIKEEVKNKFQIELHTEVVYMGDW